MNEKKCYNKGCAFYPENGMCQCCDLCQGYTEKPVVVTTSNRTEPAKGPLPYSTTTNYTLKE